MHARSMIPLCRYVRCCTDLAGLIRTCKVVYVRCKYGSYHKGTTLSLEYIKGSDSLPTSMLSVSNSVTDDVRKGHFQYTSGLFIDEVRVRLTPPLLARRRIAGFVIPWMLSLRTFLCLLAPPLPNPFPPFPRSDTFQPIYLEE